MCVVQLADDGQHHLSKRGRTRQRLYWDFVVLFSNVQLSFKLPNALLVWGQRFADIRLAIEFSAVLGRPAADSGFAQSKFAVELGDVVLLADDFLAISSLNSGVKWRRACGMFDVLWVMGVFHPSACSKRLDHDIRKPRKSLFT